MILEHRRNFRANLIALRAPYHSSLNVYLREMVELRNFATMLATSVKLAEALIAWSRAAGCPRVLLSGVSLGGWVTNLHRAYCGTADFYAPIMAGAALDEVFISSAYRRLTGPAGRRHSEALQRVLNFETAFAAVPADNVAALLMRYDAIIVHERQRRSYDPARIALLEKGHTTGALDFAALRAFLLAHLDKN